MPSFVLIAGPGIDENSSVVAINEELIEGLIADGFALLGKYAPVRHETPYLRFRVSAG